MRAASSLFVIASVGAVGPRGAAWAAPPAAASLDKMDAKALLQSGLKLFDARDYLGALAVFQSAYTRFPSAKLMINVATTLGKLDRKPEAANAYQRYLDSPDADPDKRDQVARILSQLDAAVGVVEIVVTPGGGDVQINGDAWIATEHARRYRVVPGDVTVRARRTAYRPSKASARVAAGERIAVAITLEATPAPRPTMAPPEDARVVAAPDPRPRFGAMAVVHVDVTRPGGAALVGGSFDLTGRLTAQIAAIVGPTYGGYAGASFAVLDGRLRPFVAAGMPVFASHGPRFAGRAAGGFEVAISRHVALVAELGVEHLFNPEQGVAHTSVIPAIGATARM